MTPLQIVEYYASLLIMQYANLPKAKSTIETLAVPSIMPQQSEQSIAFSPSPTSGTFVLSYDGEDSTTINWNDNATAVQTALRTISALNAVIVSGAISSGLTVDFVDVTPIAQLLVVSTNNLDASGDEVIVTIEETDETLPIAIQNGFNIDSAVGTQLDVLGKYAGVDRRAFNTPNGTIVLDDDDFRTLIKFAIVQNSAGSSLFDIENNLNLFFPDEFIVTDYKNMNMSYVFGATIGSTDLFTVLVQEKLIPKPMGVGISIFVPPVATDYFGFSTYDGFNTKVKPFNTYDDFNTSWLWLSYDDAIPV